MNKHRTWQGIKKKTCCLLIHLITFWLRTLCFWEAPARLVLSQTFATFCLVLLIMSKTRPSAKCNCYVFRKIQFGLTDYLKMSNFKNYCFPGLWSFQVKFEWIFGPNVSVLKMALVQKFYLSICNESTIFELSCQINFWLI